MRGFAKFKRWHVTAKSAVAAMGVGFIVTVPLSNAAPVAPLNLVAVPDVNVMGLLDQNSGTDVRWPRITRNGQRVALQQLGKALFYDMRVGGDGVQSCASCHYHAGADNRKVNQMSPGLKSGDTVQDLVGVGANGTLKSSDFNGAATGGLPASEAAKIGAGATPDLVDGTPGNLGGKANPALDVNDVVSSQGPRAGAYHGLTPTATPGTYGAVDTATLASSDAGFDHSFSVPAAGIPNTARRVEPRNSPTVLNAVYNLRNFWDGRADAFFNGVNPLGFRDPDSRVKVFNGGVLGTERLRIPFSSLASQAVGPIESDFEMVFHSAANNGGRPHRDLGKKLMNAQPLAGQLVACNDSLLGGMTDCTTPGSSNRGIAGTYRAMIRQIFDQRFWGAGNGDDVCLNSTGGFLGTSAAACGDVAGSVYTLAEWNFSVFFGLSVQAYEAMLTTGNTIVDLIAGGIATGTITNGAGNQQRVVNVTGLALDACIAAVSLNNSAAQVAVATNLCTKHFSKFIHTGAVTGAESATAPFGVGGIAGAAPIPANAPIGGCVTPTNTTPTSAPCSQNQANAQGAILNVDRGLNRFFAGATGCSVCHFNPEFTGATVSALTGFGAAPPAFVPPGQREAIALMERMVAFNGLPAVYDSGFYNLGVRPTPEDISLGDQIGGVPLAFTKLAEVLAGGDATGLDSAKIARVGAEIPQLFIPTSPTNLTPIPFNFNVACGAGLVGGGAANNNPNANCVTALIPGERLLRNGAFKAAGLRNVKYTGPFFHTGSKRNLRQVLEFYKTAGHFTNLNLNNLDAGLRLFALAPADESAVVELMDTGLTDWRVAYEQTPFDHPELCVPHGHDNTSGLSVLAGIPAVGNGGNTVRLQTFEEQLNSVNNRAHNLLDACTVPGMSVGGLSTIDVPPAPL